MKLFHKTNNESATRRSSGKFFGVLGFAGVILTTSACGGAVEAKPSETETSIASETASTTPKSSIAGTVVNGIPTKPELAFDGKNYYVQTTIANDDPAMVYDASKVRANVLTLFTAKEIAEGQVFATKFVAEEVLDSILNDNYADKENIARWISANKGKTTPALISGFEEYLNKPYGKENESVLIRGGYREGKYELVSGPEQTRILSRTITPTVVRGDTIEGKNYIEYEVQARVAYKVKLNGQDTVETVDGKIQTVLGKDATTGKWAIAGTNNVFTSTPAK